MAVYRSDQAQLTFTTEATPGAYPELASLSSNSGTGMTAALSAAVLKGVTQIPVDTLANGASVCTSFINSTIKIGGASGTPSEIRTVLHGDAGATGNLYLDAPLAFAHADNAVILAVNQIPTSGETTKEIFHDMVPGVYDTVDVPDPAMTIEPRYLLGTQARRNFAVALKGQQTFAGSVAGIVLLNGRPLRFPIGKAISIPATSTNRTTLASGGAAKGDVFVTVAAATGFNASSTPYIVFGANTGSTRSSVMEVRKIVNVFTSTTFQLDYPLQFTHTASEQVHSLAVSGGLPDTTFTHHIYETTDLDTVSWHVHMRDSAETSDNDFDRRYYGGLIGSASLSADEGGMLNMSWDGVNFQGMVHNQSLRATGTGYVPYHGRFQKVHQDMVDYPSTNPYFFSEGTVSLFGQTIARIRSFNINISNGEEPRYYVQKRYGQHRGPNEIREGRREYSMSATLALPDSQAATSQTTTLFKELLFEGDFGSGMQGFNVSLTFTRGTNDTITINIPDDSAAATGIHEQGAFIRTAPHSITGDNPVQVDADILFRNLKIEVVDSLYYYP